MSFPRAGSRGGDPAGTKHIEALINPEFIKAAGTCGQNAHIYPSYGTARMTDNDLYPDVGAKLTAVGAGIESFSTRLGQKGTILNYKYLKAQTRKGLIDALQAMGRYITDKYPAHPSNWATTGFDIQDFTGSTQVPQIPGDLKMKDGEYMTEAMAKYQKTQYAYYYEGRHYLVGETPPKDFTASSKSLKMVFEALEPGQNYKFEVRARGTKGVSEWSTPVEFRVR